MAHDTAPTRTENCARCAAPFVRTAGSCGTGYGEIDGALHCYACCGQIEAERMTATGKTVLYLTGNPGRYEVTDWPGTLKFRPFNIRHGRHNFARTRIDFNFIGPDGATWRGTQLGDWSQIARCSRTKERTTNTHRS